MPEQKWAVYLLLCEGGSLYCGCTTDVHRRFQEHYRGDGGRYTRAHRPITVAGQTPYMFNHSEALSFESKIKKLPKGKKLRALQQAKGEV